MEGEELGLGSEVEEVQTLCVRYGKVEEHQLATAAEEVRHREEFLEV